MLHKCYKIVKNLRYYTFMNKKERIKRKIIIVLGLSLSAYLMYSGISLLNKQEQNSKVNVTQHP